MTFQAARPEELDTVCRYILNMLPNGGVVALEGDLGTGKTALVKRFCLLIGAQEASSPTFSLQHRYEGPTPVYHYDLYMRSFEEFAALGLIEELEAEGYHLVEWADEQFCRAVLSYGYAFLRVQLTQYGTLRTIEVTQ